MIKVFHIVSSFDLGGSERVAINIAKSNNSNFEYHLFEVARGHSTFTQQMLDEFKENHIKFHRSPIANKRVAIIIFPFLLLWYCLFLKPQIIHTHTEIPDLSIFLFSGIARILFPKLQYVRTIHNTQLWNKWHKIGRKVEPFFIKENANVAISQSTLEYYANCFKQTDIPIIYNGLDEEYTQKSFEFLKAGKINILFAGRLEYQKGINELIAVIKALKNDNRFYFHIVGNGSEKVKLEKALKNIALVSLYDKIYQLDQYLSSFDFLFMPSNFEGLCLMSIEASLNKLPCIINNCPGLAETLPGNWPLKVNNNSIEEYVQIFTNKIFQINKNELIESAYSYAKEHFSLETMRQQYESLYCQKLK